MNISNMNDEEVIRDYFHTISSRLLAKDTGDMLVFQRLIIYRKILQKAKIPTDDQSLAQRDLQRFGLIVKRSGKLQVYSRIHKQYFNQRWVETQLNQNSIYQQILRWSKANKFFQEKLFTLALTWREPIRNNELEWVDKLVHTQIIENWERENEEQHKHLREIRDAIIIDVQENTQRVCQRLIIYSQILKGELINHQEFFALQDLLNIGLLVENQEKIELACQIYELVFSENWVEKELNENPIFQKILFWSEDDTSLSSELCKLVLTLDKPSDKSATEWIDELVNSQIVHNWKQGRKEYQQHWQQIRDNLLGCPRGTLRPALILYKQILQESEVEANNSSQKCIQLLNYGLVIDIRARLRVAKHIYTLVFSRDWVEEELNELKAPTQIQRLWNDYTQRIRVFIREIGLYLFGLIVLVIILILFYNNSQLNIYQDQLYNTITNFKKEQLNTLFSAIESVDKLSKIVPVDENFLLPKYPSVSPNFILQSILSKIYEQNQFEAEVFHDYAVRSVSFSQDGQHLASGGEDGSLRLWNLSDPAKNIVILPEKVNQGNVMSVSFSPQGDLIATGGQWKENKNPTFRLWDFSGKPQGKPVPIDTSGKVTSVTFSPNGQLIATLGGKKGLVKLWQIQTDFRLKEIAQLPADDKNEIESVSFNPTPNPLVIITAETQGIVKLWKQSTDDKKQFKPSIIINKQQGGIKSVIFSPNGNYIATAGKNGTVILWDSQGNQRSYPLEIGKGEQPNINFTPDGKFLATTLQNGNIQLWKLPILKTTNTGEIGDFKANKWELKDQKVDDELNGHKERVHSISFSPKYQEDSDYKYLATGGSDSTVRLWNLSKLYKEPFIDLHENIKSIVIGKVLSDGKTQRMAILQKDTVKLNSDQLIDLNSSAKTKNINISPNRELLVTVESSGEDSIVKLWDFSGSPQGNLWPIKKRAISSVILRADNKYCILFEENGKASIWEFSGNEYPLKKNLDYKVKTASFSPNEQIVAAVLKNDEIKLWNLKGEIINENFISSSNVEKVEFSPDGKFIATIEKDKKMKLWEIVKKGSQFSTQLNHKFNVDGVTTFNFSPTTATKELIATSGSGDNKVIKLWDLSGRQIAEFHGDWNQTVSLSFTPDGTQIAAAGDNGKIEQWEIETLDKLLADSCDWLKDYFLIPNHKQKLEKVDVCKKQYMKKKIHVVTMDN